MYNAAGITSFASSVFLKMVGEEETWEGTLFYGFGYICLHFFLYYLECAGYAFCKVYKVIIEHEDAQLLNRL